MSDVVISSSTFHRRAASLFKQWEAKEEDIAPLTEVDYLLVVAGNSDEENPYRKGSALQTYLLGYEFPSTLMLLGKNKVWFVVSASKAKLLQPLLNAPSSADTKIDIEILTRTKDNDENKKLFEKIIEQFPDSGSIGSLPKDKMVGKFVTEWANVLTESGKDVKQVDVGLGVSALLAVKDDEELQNERNAAKMTHKLMNHFNDVMSSAIDEGKKITHEQLGEQIEAKLEDTKFWRRMDGDGFETGFGDWCYSPIIQSGGKYDLKSSAQTDDQRLKAGVILCSLGIRYKSYCSNMGRTFMIDPDSTQESNYLYLIDLQKYILAELKDGVVVKEFYAKIVEKIQADKPELAPYFAKTLGFGMGLEFRDAAYNLNSKCTRTVKSNMIFSLSLGFNDIPNTKGETTYAISLIDTIKVGNNSSSVLTEGIKGKDEVMFYMEDEEAKPSKSSRSDRNKPSAPTAVVKSKLRNEGREVDTAALDRRKLHQQELAQKRQEEGLERFGDGEGGNESKEKKWKRFESYAREDQLPENVANQKILVDTRRSSVILPINGFAVPFHINTLKSVIKQEEGDFTLLRFNFTTPGQITGKKEDTPFEDASASFVRGVSYRSLDSFRFTELHKEITELKKTAVKRETEKKEMEDVVVQPNLVIAKRSPIKLTDVQARPAFDGKRQSGDVEIHQNGIRYQSTLKSDQKIDVLFSNIKHLIFQPCDHELIVILHIHLKNPILIGKKKAKDLQFFREASDQSFDETGNKKRRKNYADEDELEQEQEERKRRADLNRYFRAFSEKIAEASNNLIDVDMPFRDLGFQGVPFRANVLLQPTTEALVYLSEPPFLTLTLTEIEWAHLERVQFGLKNFDMVFVFRDYSRTPIHINTIPSNQLENVKDWLDSVDVPFTEGPVNLNWTAIMKTVNEDPQNFFEDGGWSFLDSEKIDEEDGEEEMSSEGSEFAAESEVSSAGDDSEDSESAFDDDEDASDDSGSEEEAGNSDDESAPDWDEQEARLEKKEREQAFKKKPKNHSDSEDEKPKKKSSSSGKNRR